MAARALKNFVDFPFRAMVSKRNVHMVCTENTADISRPAYDELHPSTGKAPSETTSYGRDVSEMCWLWTSCDIRQVTIPQDSHAQLVDAPKLCECKQERCDEMRSIIPTNSDAFNSKYLSRTSAMLPDSVHS